MSFDAYDAFTGETSNCCGARMFHGDMCSECGEHCEAEEEEEEAGQDRSFTPEQQAIITKIKEEAESTDPSP